MKNFKHKLMAVMQHLVLLYRDEALLLRYSGYQGQGVEGLWGLPGGHYIAGEPREDLLREVREETGLCLEQPLQLLKNYVVMFPDGVERFGAFYLCKMDCPRRPEIVLSGEHTKYRWIREGQAEDVTFIGPHHRKIVVDILGGRVDLGSL